MLQHLLCSHSEAVRACERPCTPSLTVPTDLASDLAVHLQDEKDGLVAQLEQMAARAESDNKRLTKGNLTHSLSAGERCANSVGYTADAYLSLPSQSCSRLAVTLRTSLRCSSLPPRVSTPSLPTASRRCPRRHIFHCRHIFSCLVSC